MSIMVELYDSDDLNNVLSLLVYAPEKVVYIVPFGTDCASLKHRYQIVLERHGIHTEMEFIPTDPYSFSALCKVLLNILSRGEVCALEMTGGTDVSLAAMGAVAAANQVPLLRFESDSKRPHWYISPCPFPVQRSPKLSCEDWFALYGAKFSTNDTHFEPWDLSDDFCREVRLLWNFCARDIPLWNEHCFFPVKLADKTGGPDPLFVSLSRASFEKELHAPEWDLAFLSYLRTHGMILNWDETPERISFRFKDLQTIRILKKSGNLLELYTCCAALSTGQFHDCQLGVFINWNGMDTNRPPNSCTTNELDVFAIRGVTPYFISCKNGEVRNDALYELQSLADHFGGSHIKKVIISTYVNPSAASRAHLALRADNMGIRLVSQVHTMDEATFRDAVFHD